MEQLNEQNQEGCNFFLTGNAQNYFLSTAKWANFFAILTFIFIPFMIIGGIVMLVSPDIFVIDPKNANTNTLMAITYLIGGVISIIPAYFLFQFSKRAKQTLLEKNPLALELSAKMMRAYWKFSGILTIISFIILALVLIVVGITTALSAVEAMPY